ncbi:hypothetical protein Lqui_0882 [Legionella quinlivanii]|uniref:DUF1841 domain-containing protein n=1 Tax=Legionella quinlivanii TaxID=45073 RepID=A0A0W0Y5V8_9GAMM|nr:DUF1841 family protein [Legionella quinlivanii]KTD52038.1 hypothetical protein Lqui_0882 [Legionella quinlivanii]SEF88332.1 protein of unknown function [Legionella quinlivanii DSM 21216]STY12466.1 Domain of uncharacterised function (DUF1841) [Legionella quinlivanii]
MFYGDNVQDTRQVFFECWRKYRQQEALTALEQQVVNVILAHPEYHAILDDSLGNLAKTYTPEMGQSNPFLHLGLHLAIRDQITTNRPAGILAIYQQLMASHQDELQVEHLMMECLAETLWQAQRGMPPQDIEDHYLLALKRLKK